MKTFLATTALALLLAACTQPTANTEGMMSGDMMKNCQSHMKGGKMMGGMPMDMTDKCQQMMKDCPMMSKNGMTPGKKGMADEMMKQCRQKMQNPSPDNQPASPADSSDEGHKNHHPAQ